MKDGKLTNSRLTDTDDDPRNGAPNTWQHVFGLSAHMSARSKTQSFGYVNGNIYIPSGYERQWNSFTSDGAWFYNPTTNITILVMHVDPNKIAANLKRNITNDAGSIFIGQMTNGGGRPGYIHAHIEAHRGRGVPNASFKKFPDQVDRDRESQRLRNKTRIFFPDIFCSK